MSNHNSLELLTLNGKKIYRDANRNDSSLTLLGSSILEMWTTRKLKSYLRTVKPLAEFQVENN